MSHESTAAILLVDRDPTMGRAIMAYLAGRSYAVDWVDAREKACNRLDARLFDVLIAELNAQGVDGMRLMSLARERNPEICVIFIADYPDVELAVEAMHQGAYDYQTKPINLGKLEAVIARGLEHQRLVMEQHELRRRLDEQYGLGNLVGNSRQMIRVYDAVRKVAPAKTPVLVRGETGTGKDLIALAIHNSSPRRDEPFVKVQCGGLPEDRVEDELFGPAAGGHPGRVELADKGTLFLDEVGELSLALQERLRDAIERQHVRRPGGARAIAVDVRFIAGTRLPLDDSTFLPGLHALFRTVTIEAPALRERREDIPLLVHHILREASRTSGKAVPGITQNALDLLMRYDWPGNVRELKNIVEGLALMAGGSKTLDVRDVPQHIRHEAASQTNEIRVPIGAAMSEVERVVIEETMKACGYNKESCARTLGIGLRTLYRKLKQYEIS